MIQSAAGFSNRPRMATIIAAVPSFGNDVRGETLEPAFVDTPRSRLLGCSHGWTHSTDRHCRVGHDLRSVSRIRSAGTDAERGRLAGSHEDPACVAFDARTVGSGDARLSEVDSRRAHAVGTDLRSGRPAHLRGRRRTAVASRSREHERVPRHRASRRAGR